MYKKLKKALQTTIGVGMLGSSIICTVPVLARNANKCSWAGNAPTPGVSIKSGVELKETSMYVGAEYITG